MRHRGEALEKEDAVVGVNVERVHRRKEWAGTKEADEQRDRRRAMASPAAPDADQSEQSSDRAKALAGAEQESVETLQELPLRGVARSAKNTAVVLTRREMHERSQIVDIPPRGERPTRSGQGDERIRQRPEGERAQDQRLCCSGALVRITQEGRPNEDGERRDCQHDHVLVREREAERYGRRQRGNTSRAGIGRAFRLHAYALVSFDDRAEQEEAREEQIVQREDVRIERPGEERTSEREGRRGDPHGCERFGEERNEAADDPHRGRVKKGARDVHAEREVERWDAGRKVRDERVERISRRMGDTPRGRRGHELGGISDHCERAVGARYVKRQRREREREENDPAKAKSGVHCRQCYVLAPSLSKTPERLRFTRRQ